MYNPGLGTSRLKYYNALIASNHSIVISVRVMNMNHAQISDISNRLVGGQVTVDASRDVTRSLSLTLLDPGSVLHLDSRSPDAGALFADRMLHIIYTVINPAGDYRASFPVFTGPITKMDRSGNLITLEAQGMETLGMTQQWSARTYKKGLSVSSVIRSILQSYGEGWMSIPNTAHKLPRNVSVGGTEVQQTPWQIAKGLASSIGYQLFYNGNGYAIMRKVPGGAVWLFRTGSGGMVTSDPQIGFDTSNVINAVEVWGKKPDAPKKGKTAKKQPNARAIAARSHPFSPWTLGRNGVARYIPQVIQSDSYTTNSQCLAAARAALARGLLQSTTVAFDALPLPNLEELDVVRVQNDKFASNFRVSQFAIPLTSESDMTVGYVKNLTPSINAVRRRR